MVVNFALFQILVIAGSQYPVGFVFEHSPRHFEQQIEPVSFQAFNRSQVLPMGVLGGSRPEDYPESPFTNIMGLNLVLELASSHMTAVEFKIEVFRIEGQHRVGVSLEGQEFHKPVPADKEIFTQTVPELNVVFDLPVIERCLGVGSQGIAGIEFMLELLKANILPLRPAHTIEFGSDNGIIAPPPLSGKKETDIGGGSPFHFGKELPDS